MVVGGGWGGGPFLIGLRGAEFRAWESGLEQPHEQNGPVLLQNVAPRALEGPFFDPKTQNPV